jgi:hypothetical protein
VPEPQSTEGQDCAFALLDSLLEAGHAGLAEHFRQETWHPKGYWAMDWNRAPAR